MRQLCLYSVNASCDRAFEHILRDQCCYELLLLPLKHGDFRQYF